MKRLLTSLLIILGACVGAHATANPGFVYDTPTLQYKFTIPANTASTNTIIISLSDTVNWPHKRKGELQIYGLNVAFDKVAASSATVSLGVVTYVGPSTGSISYFMIMASSRNVANTQSNTFNISQCVINLKVVRSPTLADVDGTTPYLITNNKLSGSVNISTSAILPSTIGFTAPHVGDLIMTASNKDVANAVDVYVQIQYNGEN